VRLLFLILLLCLSGAVHPAEAAVKLRLKTAATATADVTANRRGYRKSFARQRVHLIVQFEAPPKEQQLRALAGSGVQVLRPVPDNGYLVSAPAALRLRGAGIRRVTAMKPEEKISPLLKPAAKKRSPVEFLAEFHPDVPDWEARRIAGRANLRIHDNPDLESHQLLVEGDGAAIARLARWDEVAYLFPASWELEHGVPVVPCVGAVTSQGRVGQYVATVGDGWEGPGRHAATLTYSFEKLTRKLPAGLTKEEIQKALKEWSRYVKVTFVPGGWPHARRNLNFLFATGDHGDSYPFDGPGRVLAHSFYPAPPNPEPIAGDVHFDEDETWRVGARVDLFSIALHELGHALGLGHSDNPNDVMYPYYRMVSGLSEGDVAAIRSLYAAAEPDEEPAAALEIAIEEPAASLTTEQATIRLLGVVTGGTDPVTVRWRSNRGPSGVATGSRNWVIESVPLYTGDNAIIVTATDERQTTVSASVRVTRVEPPPPEVEILSPAGGGVHETGQSSILITGTASHAGGIARVYWVSSSGASGDATGTTNWSAGPVPLQEGLNTITVTAVTGTGKSASATLSVRYAPPADPSPPPENPPTSPPSDPPADSPSDPPSPPSDPPESPPSEPPQQPDDPPAPPASNPPATPPAGPDLTNPDITIVEPATNNIRTTLPAITLRGTASDNIAVVRVTWSTNAGREGTADGVHNWHTEPIPLLVGFNLITVRAFDAAGNSAWRSVMVTRH